MEEVVPAAEAADDVSEFKAVVDDADDDVLALARRAVYEEPIPLLLVVLVVVELLSVVLSSLFWLLLELVAVVVAEEVVLFDEVLLMPLLKLLIGGAETGLPIEFNDVLDEETVTGRGEDCLELIFCKWMSNTFYLLALFTLLILRCDMELAAAITAGALGMMVLLVGGYVLPALASSNLNCFCFGFW